MALITKHVHCNKIKICKKTLVQGLFSVKNNDEVKINDYSGKENKKKGLKCVQEKFY